jgi:hypothetical protein
VDSSSINDGAGVPLRIHLSDGSVETFMQPDQEKAREIWLSTEPARFFAQPRVVLAGTYSKAVFVCSEIVRLDFLDPTCACWKLPEDCSDIVELSASDFANRAHLDRPELMPKREQSRHVGDLMVSFVKLYFRNHPPIHVMFELSVKLAAESQSYMRFLLSKTGFQMRLGGHSGVGLVNLAHLAGYAAYPGVAQVPADAWPAEPVEESQLRAEAA